MAAEGDSRALSFAEGWSLSVSVCRCFGQAEVVDDWNQWLQAAGGCRAGGKRTRAWRLKGGWVMWSFVAALVICPSSATVRKYFSCRNVIVSLPIQKTYGYKSYVYLLLSYNNVIIIPDLLL